MSTHQRPACAVLCKLSSTTKSGDRVIPSSLLLCVLMYFRNCAALGKLPQLHVLNSMVTPVADEGYVTRLSTLTAPTRCLAPTILTKTQAMKAKCCPTC
eukprot:2761884-Amphidinium_carterae.1